MIILNFTHPLTVAQMEQIMQKTGMTITTVHDTPCQFDNSQDFIPQINEVVARVPLTAEEWQTAPLLINPPAYAPATMILLAEIHDRMGYFPSIIRIRPQTDSNPPRFEVAEIINLHEVREKAREKRRM